MQFRQPLRRSQILAVASFALLLSAVLLISMLAAGIVGAFEPENTTLASGAKAVTAAGASGGRAMQFGPPSAPTLVPSGFPGAASTGYKHAPGYPGHLTPWPGGPIRDNTTYSFYDFPGSLDIGSTGSHPKNVTFYGSRFHGAAPHEALVKSFADGVTFRYVSFEPGISAPPVSCAQSYEYWLAYDGGTYNTSTGALTVDHSDIWGFGGSSFGGSTQGKPHVFTNNWIHDSADADGRTGCGYHNDGIYYGDGQAGGGVSYVTIDHNTIESFGNTQGIALQTDFNHYYSHITVTRNLLGGWGYSMSIGNAGTGNSAITVTNNVLSTRLPYIWGPLYGWAGTGNTWRRNTWLVPGGGDRNSQYWWPIDASGHAMDYSEGYAEASCRHPSTRIGTGQGIVSNLDSGFCISLSGS